MALHNDPRLYSGGSVVLDPTPTINLYGQLMAKRQAKQDALDQYYQKALSDITPAGMRNKDVVGGWAEKVNNWQTKYMSPEKKKFLLNPRLDNYRTITEFNQEHQDLIADAQKSKEKLAGEKQWYELHKSARFNPTEEDMKLHDRYSKSIYDPTRLDESGNEPDLADLSYNAPELTAQQLLQYNKAIESGFKRGKQPIGTPVKNPVTGMVDQQYQDVFTPEQATKMADAYGDIVSTNKSLTNHYNNMLHSGDIEHMDKLNTAFKSAYPNDTMDTPEKIAKAEVILLKTQPSNIRTESTRDVYSIMNKAADIAKEKAAQQDVYTMKHIATSWGYRMQEGKNLQETVDNNYDADKNYAADHDGAVPTTPAKLKTLTGTTTGTLSMKDGDYIWKHGDKIEVIPGNQAKIKMMIVQKPAFVPGVTTANKGNTPTNKTYIYNGKPIGYDKIEKAAKQSGLSVDEYMKQIGIKQK